MIRLHSSKLSVWIHSGDHNPPHVHVIYGSAADPMAEMLIDLRTWKPLEGFGFSRSDVKTIIGGLKVYEAELKAAWEERNG